MGKPGPALERCGAYSACAGAQPGALRQSQHQHRQLVQRIAGAGNSAGLRGNHRSLVRAVGNHQHRHRGHHACRGGNRLHDLRHHWGCPVNWVAVVLDPHLCTCGWPCGLPSCRLVHTLRGEPDSGRSSDKPVRPGVDRVLAFRGDRQDRHHHRGGNLRIRPASAVRDPGYRRSAVPGQADLLDDVPGCDRHLAGDVPHAVGACGCDLAGRIPMPPRRWV